MFKFKFKTQNKGMKTRTQMLKPKQMCKTQIQINIYCNEIRKHKHENNITKVWCEIVFQIGVEQTKCNRVLPLFISF
jgi:hypothetical protein